MNRRTAAGTLFVALAMVGGAALVGAAAVPDAAPYLAMLLLLGLVACILSIGGFAAMMMASKRAQSFRASPHELELRRHRP